MQSPKLDKTNLIFNSFYLDENQRIKKSDFIKILTNKGIFTNDSRLLKNFKLLKDVDYIDIEIFNKFMQENNSLLVKIFKNELIIPKWNEFVEEIDEIIESLKGINKGNVASYIPQLAKVNPDLFGVSITTIDGQTYKQGDTDYHLCVQSCKPISIT